MLYGWLEGDSPERGRDWELVIQELMRLHRLTRGWPQRPGLHSTQERLTEDAGRDVRLDLMPPDAVAYIRYTWRAILDVSGTRLFQAHGSNLSPFYNPEIR